MSISNTTIRPEDVLPNGEDFASINGKHVRKGTIAAFLANADVLEDKSANEQQKEEAICFLKTLAPDVIAIGLHKHVVFKNSCVEAILAEAQASINDSR